MHTYIHTLASQFPCIRSNIKQMISEETSLGISNIVPQVLSASTMVFIPIKAMHAIPRSELNVEDTLEKLCSY